jgi:hypothetical protein
VSYRFFGKLKIPASLQDACVVFDFLPFTLITSQSYADFIPLIQFRASKWPLLLKSWMTWLLTTAFPLGRPICAELFPQSVSLLKIHIPASVESIRENAFSH